MLNAQTYLPYALSLVTLIPQGDASLEQKISQLKLGSYSSTEVLETFKICLTLQKMAGLALLNICYTDLTIISAIGSYSRPITKEQVLGLLVLLFAAHLSLIPFSGRLRSFYSNASHATMSDKLFFGMPWRSSIFVISIVSVLFPAGVRFIADWWILR